MKALIIHRDMMPALNTLSDAHLGQLTRCALSLVNDERDEAPEEPTLAFAWNILRTKILEHGRKYDEECQRRSDHARRAADARHAPAPAFPSMPRQARA